MVAITLIQWVFLPTGETFGAVRLGQGDFPFNDRDEVTFTKVLQGPVVSDGGWSYAMAWADFNDDGFADLFVTNNDANNGQHNFLYSVSKKTQLF